VWYNLEYPSSPNAFFIILHTLMFMYWRYKFTAIDQITVQNECGDNITSIQTGTNCTVRKLCECPYNNNNNNKILSQYINIFQSSSTFIEDIFTMCLE
jgi:hypothetical protein